MAQDDLGRVVMVEIDKIISERSDERILKALKDISDQEFTKLVESILSYLELKLVRARPKGTFYVAECTHRPDGKKYVVFFSRSDEVISKGDMESLLSYMTRAESPNGLVLTISSIASDAASFAEANNIGLADATKLSALLRRFDLDKEVMRSADLWRERAQAAKVPGSDRALEGVMKDGYDAIAAKDFMKALEKFDHAIMLKEDYDVPWRMKGNTLDEMGYHEQALECYKHALALFTESDETWFSLGGCLFSLGRYAEEVVCYDRVLQHNPGMQKALINKGSTLHRLGRYEEALETYDKVLKINYRLEKVHNNRGATLHAMDRLNEALQSYNHAIELKHDYVEAWMNKGSLLYEMGKYGEAFEAFTQMTHVRPELPKGWYLRGLAAKKTGTITQAKSSFEAALRLDPDYVDAKRALDDISKKIAEKFSDAPRIVQDIFTSESVKVGEPKEMLEAPILSQDVLERVREEKIEELAEEVYGDKAELLLLLGRMEEAFDFLGKSLRLEGENPSLLTQAGNVLHGLGKTEAAVKSYEHALLADPKYTPALMNLHALLTDQGELEKAAKISESLRKSVFGWQALGTAALEASARKDFKRALEDIDLALALEDVSELQNLKGLLRLIEGDPKAAAETFEKTKAMPLDPAEGFNNSGATSLKGGEPEKASSEFDRTIKLQRNNPAAWNNRGCVLYKVERVREAIACFEESVVMAPTSVALSNKGFSQLTIDLLLDALKTFEQSLSVAETPEGYNNKGIVLERMGKRDEAQVAFKEALRLAPQFKDAIENGKRSGLVVEPVKEPVKQQPLQSAAPSEAIVGDKEVAQEGLAKANEQTLKGMRKAELEALCESLAIDPNGTKSELIRRLLNAKSVKPKR
jgi:tetratricopeptide (TPR) repeat protein